MKKTVRLLTIVFLALGLAGLRAVPVHAATALMVSDCSSDSGAGTLRDAVSTANTDNAGDTIGFSCSGTIKLAGTLDVSGSMSIDGSGQSVVIDGSNGGSPVELFAVSSGVNLALSSLTLQKGSKTSSSSGEAVAGGAIANAGTLTITASTLSNNTANGGGAIYNVGTVTVTSSTVSDNSGVGGGGAVLNYGGTVSIATSTLSGNSSPDGGAIENYSGTLTVSESTFSDNSVSGGGLGGEGGAIFNLGTATVTSSTFSNNSASDTLEALGGAILNSGTLSIASSTLTGNSAIAGSSGFLSGSAKGGAIANTGTLSVASSTLSGNSSTTLGGAIAAGGTVTIGASILALNAVQGTGFFGSAPNNCDTFGGSIVDTGYNLTDGDSCGLTGATDIQNADPQLDSLANNGGPTQTMALKSTSPAIDAITNSDSLCSSSSTDQRGQPRPDEAGTGCDIGAYESASVGEPSRLSVDAVTGTYGGTATLTATLMSGSTPLGGKTVTFSFNGTPVCGGAGQHSCPTTSSSGVATLSDASLVGVDVGTYPFILTCTALLELGVPLSGVPIGVTADFAGDTDANASTACNTLTVNKAPLTITANNHSYIYGGTAPTLDVSYSGLASSDSSASFSGTLACNVYATTDTTFSTPLTTGGTSLSPGNYVIHCGGLTDSNYTITWVDGTLTVNNATLTITADNKSVQYGDPLPALTVSYNGFANGDGPSVLGGMLICHTTATTNSNGQVTSPAGLYPITCSGQTSSTYTIVYKQGTLTVSGEDVVVKPAQNNPSAVQVTKPGGSAPAMTFTARITEAADGSYGDITKASPITFTLNPIGSGSHSTCTVPSNAGSVTQVVPPTTTSPGFEVVKCTFPAGMPVNVYDLTISVGGNYYRGSSDSAVTVYDPSQKGIQTGGGMITNPMTGNTVSFGFTASYNSSGGTVGKMLYVETNGTGIQVAVLKGNVMSTMAITTTGGAYPETAKITGKATLNGNGNYSYILQGLDSAGTANDADQFGMQVRDPFGVTVNNLTFGLQPLPSINGVQLGNIYVK